MTNTSAILSNTIKPIVVLQSTSIISNIALGNVTAHTLHNMKEFQQNTVNTVVRPVSQATTNAMLKIENFQDEAAGVVEGILDFGMAGLRKGLRLTGLPDNFSELTNKNKNEHKTEQTKDDAKMTHKLTKAPRLKSVEEKLKLTGNESDFEESVWINPLKESPNYDGNILLEKTPETENCNKINNKLTIRQDIPQIAEDVLLINDSPEPEYEEAADFATTIAKLRSLLQQKSSESGISTPSLSPMLYDEFHKPSDEGGNVGEVIAIQNEQDIARVDGTMPSLYKFCARTATGVFQNTLNTIKTALPGTVNETTQDIHNSAIDNWTFVEVDSFSDDFQSRMEKLISERRAFCTIDTAYEAINSLDVADQPGTTWSAAAGLELLDDEPDEFTYHIPVTKSFIDIICEVLFDSNNYMTQETTVRIFLLLLGTTCENFFNSQSETLLHSINKFVGKLPNNSDDSELTIELDEMVQWCIGCMPSKLKRYLPKLFGDKALQAALKLLLSSFQSQKINQHLLIQIFDLCALELILANNKFTPAYSA
ncbi:uncharacterized protein LOC108739328 [Agrilus planipennis]|uniref:Uncharacterized protein LOC108739328 n=1 Tax=Agrilus planipennis TaxID=224129 RepID=A0A7F5R485_AGRPL|nr:uncharacterized protein LOC108739328 [Agrilus planipennis]